MGFLPVSLGGFLAAGYFGGTRSAQIWLLVASLFFYAWWNPYFVSLLIASILLNYGVGIKLRRGINDLFWLISGLILDLGVLVFFKYSNFLASLFGIRLPIGDIFLPLGISFFTFQQVMFLVDTYRREIIAFHFLDYACFIAFFPHLIAGPIVRPKNIIPQFARLLPLVGGWRRLSEGLEIFFLGLAKKLVLADGLAHFANPGFAAAGRHDAITFIEAWAALLAYGLQIYFDFSGYSDMAIGLARIFGIHFPQNFNSPYKAENISDFWKRWNITLSGFLRDYLYISLGGNRHGELRRILNVSITMLLGGLWHGASMRFLLWGGLHSAFLIIHGWFIRTGILLPRVLSKCITLGAVLLAWVPFRATSFSATRDFYRGLFGLNGIAAPEIIMRAVPWLSAAVRTVTVLPYLGDARTLSLPQSILFLLPAWVIALALPNTNEMTKLRRSFALIGSFAFIIQGLFFAPFAVPFLYFQF